MSYRNTTKLASASAALALTLGLAQTARAEIFTATYTGTVSNGYDIAGVFGAPNTDLTGDSFKVVYTINDANGALYNDPGYVSYLEGGAEYDGAYPGNISPVSAAVSVNRRTFNIEGDYIGYAYQTTSSTSESAVYHVAEDYVNDGIGDYTDNYVDAFVYGLEPFVLTSNLRGPLSHAVQPGDAAGGQVVLDSQVAGFQMENAYASFDPTYVTIGAPEPSAWALMLLGVGAVGFGMRMRRTVLA